MVNKLIMTIKMRQHATDRTKTEALLTLLRPHYCFLGAVFVLVGMHLSGQATSVPPFRVIVGITVVMLIIAYSFVINDYKDLELDRTAKPYRPLPSGKISVPEVWVLIALLVVSALFLAATLGSIFFVAALGNLVLSTLYSYVLKGTVLLGHISIALLNASIVFWGALLAGQINTTIWLTGFIVIHYVVSSELLYAIEDRPSDVEGGVQTTATILGEKLSLRLFYGLGTMLILVGLAPWVIGYASVFYGIVSLFLCALPLAVMLNWLSSQPTMARIHRSRTVMKTIRYLSVVPILLLNTPG